LPSELPSRVGNRQSGNEKARESLRGLGVWRSEIGLLGLQQREAVLLDFTLKNDRRLDQDQQDLLITRRAAVGEEPLEER
jgi:hypothetical protein